MRCVPGFWRVIARKAWLKIRDAEFVTREMVDAALAGFDLGEQITVPSLPDTGDWQRFVKAREDLRPNLSHRHSAPRYKIPVSATAA